ncbi:MAG: response regulator [Flavobacterium sp.]|jgi:CheY-like chemotaxis protein|uniref:response regulator n=1 Tax=Flavobacterium sp. TaxID=239 RepID=UPI003BA5980A
MLKKVLCVDDDPITLMLCKKVIIKAAFSEEIIFANNGKDAIDLIDNFSSQKNNEKLEMPQLIFLDLNMPIMNGWDFLKQFQENYAKDFSDTRVIILSSTIDPSDHNKAKQYENIVSHFLSKPITVEMLEELKPLYS